MKQLTTIKELESGKLILLVSSEFCPDCIVLNNYIDQVVDKYQEQWKFIYVDREQNPEIVKFYNVLGIPSFIALKDGNKVADFISKEAKTYDQICDWIDQIE